MAEAWKAWEEYQAEKHQVYPNITIEGLEEDTPFALFREGWNRGVTWCTELLEKIEAKEK